MSVCVSLVGFVLSVCGAADTAAESFELEVVETAGIQRFSYPLSCEFLAPPGAKDPGRYRLLEGSRPMQAQFTILDDCGSEKPSRWSADFQLDLLPHQKRVLTLLPAAGAEPLPRRARGITVEQTQDQIRVVRPELEFVVSKNLAGLLRSIKIGGEEWLVPDAPGLALHFRDGRSEPLTGLIAGAGAKVLKSGPLAARIDLVGVVKFAADKDKDVESRVQLELPLGKSWLELDWSLDDPADLVSGMSASLRMDLKPSPTQPTLADCAAQDWTYAALKPQETLAFYACSQLEPGWRVDRAIAGLKTPYVLPRKNGAQEIPSGWAHLMDDRRCVAIAVDRFGQTTKDVMELSADGRIVLRREFVSARAEAGRKQWRFWMHFVHSPPQIGAATSPQSMLSPPEIHVKPIVDKAPRLKCD